VYKALDLSVIDTYVPCIPAAALSLLHVAQCMLWCACMYWHVRFSARIRSLFAWMLSYTTVSGNPWLLSSMSTTTGVCVNYHASSLLIIFLNVTEYLYTNSMLCINGNKLLTLLSPFIF